MIVKFNYKGTQFKIDLRYLAKDSIIREQAERTIEEEKIKGDSVDLGKWPDIAKVSVEDMKQYLNYRSGKHFELTKGFFNISSYEEGLDNHFNYPKEYAEAWLKTLREEVSSIRTHATFNSDLLGDPIISKYMKKGWIMAGPCLMETTKEKEFFYLGDTTPEIDISDFQTYTSECLVYTTEEYGEIDVCIFHTKIFKTEEDIMNYFTIAKVLFIDGEKVGTPLVKRMTEIREIFIDPNDLCDQMIKELSLLASSYRVKPVLFDYKRFDRNKYEKMIDKVILSGYSETPSVISELMFIERNPSEEKTYREVSRAMLEKLTNWDFLLLASIYYWLPNIFILDASSEEFIEELDEKTIKRLEKDWKIFKSEKKKTTIRDIEKWYKEQGYYN